LPKLRLDGENETPGEACRVPVPLRETVCGLPVALSVTESVPLKLPEVAGVKVTLMVQFAAAARLEPQLLVCEKFPVTPIAEIVSVAVPELVSVTGIFELVVPTT
jgi:hypothetical protein